MEKKNAVLRRLAELLRENGQRIMEVNAGDVAECSRDDEALFDRLKIDEKKVEGMIGSVEMVLGLEDPEDKVLSRVDNEGLRVENRTIAFGTVLIVYESRPDVTIEASVIAFKAGNRVLLKGGKEAKRTNLVLVELWQQALEAEGLEREWVRYVEAGREEVQQLVRGEGEKVDLIVPRGGEGLIKFVEENAKVPVIVSGRGNNFLYIGAECDFEMAVKVVLNGKSRISVCNALDKVLVDQAVERDKVEGLVGALVGDGIEVLNGDEMAEGQKEEMLRQEFLASKIMVMTVSGVEEAIRLINQYSGGHTASVVTTNTDVAERFQREVDCAAVMHNASTRLTDGSIFGYGAEIATSTQKLHSRGPIGVGQMVTNKWFVFGDGHTR